MNDIKMNLQRISFLVGQIQDDIYEAGEEIGYRTIESLRLNEAHANLRTYELLINKLESNLDRIDKDLDLIAEKTKNPQ